MKLIACCCRCGARLTVCLLHDLLMQLLHAELVWLRERKCSAMYSMWPITTALFHLLALNWLPGVLYLQKYTVHHMREMLLPKDTMWNSNADSAVFHLEKALICYWQRINGGEWLVLCFSHELGLLSPALINLQADMRPLMQSRSCPTWWMLPRKPSGHLCYSTWTENGLNVQSAYEVL